MIVIDNYGVNSDDMNFEELAAIHEPQGNTTWLIPNLQVNQGVEDPKQAIFTLSALRAMRKARSLKRVPEFEMLLALAEGEPTERQQILLNQQAEDFIAADLWYENMKAENVSRISELTHVVLDQFASELGHSWSSSSINTKEEKVQELVNAGLI